MTLAMFKYIHNRPASAFVQRTSCIFLPRAKADLILSCQASETATPHCCIRLVAEVSCCSLLVHLQIFISSNNLDQSPKRHPGLAAKDSIPFFHPQRRMIHEMMESHESCSVSWPILGRFCNWRIIFFSTYIILYSIHWRR